MYLKVFYFSSAEPSLTPVFAWSLQKVRDGKVVGSTPTIQVFGDLKETDEGLELNGKDSWLDAGDFKGNIFFSSPYDFLPVT